MPSFHVSQGGRNADSYGWDRDSPSAVNIHSTACCISQYQVIQGLTLSASIQRSWENRSVLKGGVKGTLWLTALSFLTLMLIFLLVGVLVNAAISSERKGSKMAVKTIMNNIDYSRKDQPLHLNKMLDLPVEMNQTSTYIYMQCMPMPNMQCMYLTPVFLLHIFLI